MVDDGSTDGTGQVVTDLARSSGGHAGALLLTPNRGKAEAVRQGMLAALESGADYVGFWDADLATPFDALADFLALAKIRPDLDIIMGSRVQLLGRRIDRTAPRHYVGRVFATLASLVLSLPVYDTQCGAKLFRAGRRLGRILRQPFVSGWIFDVELLARYLDDVPEDDREPPPSSARIYELALRAWADEPGSKVKSWDGFRAAVDLYRIARRRRRAA